MRKKILVALLLIIASTIMLLSTTVKATYRSNDPTVKSGETITITVTSTEALENYDLSLGKHEGLTYVSCSATNAAVNSSTGQISFATLGNAVTTLGTYTFKAPQVTQTTKYTVIFNINGTTNTSTVTVNPATSTNNNNGNGSSTTQPEKQKGTVSSCYINGYKISEYLTVTNKDSVSVKVNTSTGEGLKIYNSLTKKTISASSGKEVTVPIVEGTNTLTITLNSGNSVTRKIYSQKEEEVEANQIEDETKEEVKVTLKNLEINIIELETEEKTNFKLTPEFSSEIYEYSIIIPEEYNHITKLDIKAIGEQDDFIIEITGNENLVDGENIVTILVKSKDGEKIATYKIIVNKTPKAIEAVTEPLEEVEQVIEEDNEKIKITKIVIVVFTVILTIAGIIFAVIEYMYGKKHNEENDFGEIPYANIGFKKEDEEEEGNATFVKEEKRKGKHF